MAEAVSEEDVVLTEMLTHEKPCQFLLQVLRKNQAFSDEEAYASKISKEIDGTYAHVVKISQKFEKAGLITREKDGRKELLELTEAGQEIAEAVSNLYQTLEEEGESSQ